MNPNTPQSGKGGTTSGSGQPKSSTTGTTSSSISGSASGAGSTSGTSTFGSTSSASGSSASGSDVAQKAAGLVDTVKQQASSQLNAQKQKASDGIGSVVAAVRQTSEKLREGQQAGVAQYVERAADQLERFSNHLRDRDIDELMNEARNFARRQPALFVGSSFAIGLVAARFFKASSPDRDYEGAEWQYGGGSGPYGSEAASGLGYTGAGYSSESSFGGAGGSGATGYGGTGASGTSGYSGSGSTGSAGETTSTRPKGFEGGF